MTRQLALLQFCDELQRAAEFADTGTWRGDRPAGIVVTDGRPAPSVNYPGGLICESAFPSDIIHIVATQPKVAIAIADKLREAHSLISEAVSISNIMGRLLMNLPPAFPIDTPFHDDISRLGGRLHAFSARIVAFSMIEVP